MSFGTALISHALKIQTDQQCLKAVMYLHISWDFYFFLFYFTSSFKPCLKKMPQMPQKDLGTCINKNRLKYKVNNKYIARR